MTSDTIEILRALEVVTGRSCLGLDWDADMIMAFRLDARLVMQMAELVEETCGVTLLPVHVLDWVLGHASVRSLELLVATRRAAATVSAASPVIPVHLVGKRS